MTISRRTFLQAVAAGSGSLGLTGLLSACGSDAATPATGDSSTNQSTVTTGSPRTGGTLRAGISGGSSSDTVNPLLVVSNADFARVNNLFDPLLRPGADGNVEFVLADEVTPNAEATAWTVRLREGVEFHNGKTLTADDLLYTYQQILDPAAPTAAGLGLPQLDVTKLRKVDERTVEFGCHVPFGTFVQALASFSNVLPTDFDPAKPVGTGPFAYKSFSAGQQSTFVRAANYWRSDRPFVDELIITNYADETSQLNALISGEVDVVNLLSTDALTQLEGGGKKSLISAGGGWNPFTMRVDKAPFDDVRVRQALRLAVDRKQMLDLVFGGHGTIGNDVFGIWAPEYNRDLPQREYDPDQAKSLLKSAGQDGLTIELVTAPIGAGVVKCAQVFAQQAAAAGITINLRTVTTTEFFGDNYLSWDFAQDYWFYNFYLPQVGLATSKTAPYNETHFANDAYEKLYQEANATADDAQRAELAHEMQKIDYEEGGYIIPFFPPVIDGYAPNVNGLVESKSGLSLNNYDFGGLWLS
jgi:peptide/nickel transport system substrate-binding protein